MAQQYEGDQTFLYEGTIFLLSKIKQHYFFFQNAKMEFSFQFVRRSVYSKIMCCFEI